MRGVIDLDEAEHVARHWADRPSEVPEWHEWPQAVLELIARVRVAEDAARYLFESWAGAEGDGQPTRAVFGDSDMDPQYARYGAPEEVQALMRRLCK